MKQTEYTRKKRESLRCFCKEHCYDMTPEVIRIFGYAFDRAYTLGKQKKDADAVIQGWVARDSNESLYLFCLKPKRVRYLGSSDGVWMSRTIEKLDPSLFPDLTWESDPEPIEIIIKRKKK